MLGKNTILKAIHNFSVVCQQKNCLRMLGKNTILKAIHNNQTIMSGFISPANAR